MKYVLWGEAWVNIQMMLADTPKPAKKVKSDDGANVTESVSLDDEDALTNFINKKNEQQQRRP